MLSKRFWGGVVGGASFLFATAAMADTYQARYPDVPLVGATPSIGAAMNMGAYGFGAWQPSDPNWRSLVLDECERQSQAARMSGTTPVIWFHGSYKECNPRGVATTFSLGRAITGTTLVMPNQTWLYRSYKATEGPAAASAVVEKMILYRTPGVVSLYGNWDHWAAITQVIASKIDGIYEIDSLLVHDGVQTTDSSGKPTLFRAEMDYAIFGVSYWYAIRFPPSPVCTGAVPCGGAVSSDPWHRKYVLLYEPPPGSSLLPTAAPELRVRNVEHAGVTSSGERMSAALASSRVFSALRYANAGTQRDMQAALANSYAGEAVLVEGVAPSGARWDYYLVPMLRQAGVASAFVMLSAANGAFQELAVPDHAVPYRPMDENSARQEAASLLKQGETLGRGQLTWNPEFMAVEAHSPYLPFFQFPVLDSSGKERARIRISHNGGRQLGREGRE